MARLTPRGRGLCACVAAILAMQAIPGAARAQESGLFSMATRGTGSAQPAARLSANESARRAGVGSGASVQAGPVQPTSGTSGTATVGTNDAAQVGGAAAIEMPAVYPVWTSVERPLPKEYQVQDLVTIIIQESSRATLESKLDTEKESNIQGSIDAIPRLRLKDLLNAQIRGNSTGPEVGMQFSNEFETEGEYERKESMSTRLTARIIDIKPNGLLVLEGRTLIQNDDEVMSIAVTGVARPADITATNTLLSTQMYDLRVRKTHDGELRKVQEKGLIPKFFEMIFNF